MPLGNKASVLTLTLFEIQTNYICKEKRLSQKLLNKRMAQPFAMHFSRLTFEQRKSLKMSQKRVRQKEDRKILVFKLCIQL